VQGAAADKHHGKNYSVKSRKQIRLQRMSSNNGGVREHRLGGVSTPGRPISIRYCPASE
jgi:hypothetical protein